MRRAHALIAAAGLLIVGCGSSSKHSSGAANTNAASGAATTTAAASSTSVASSGAGTGGIAVTEKEFSIDLAIALKAGANTLTPTNSGSFPHELKVIKADSYATLPKTADGVVDEAALGAAVVGKSGRVASGASGTLSVTLDAGKYVLVCNLGAGGNNHAAKGMHIDITVS